jgi:OTU domain-containing protein 6
VQQRPVSFKKLSITGDGSCMFRAVMQGHHYLQQKCVMPSNDERQQALQLRRAVVDELRRRQA